MKNRLVSALFICLCFAVQAHAQELKSEHIFDLEITVNPPQVIGPVMGGTRLIYPFKEGAVKGGKVNGKIIECSGEWGLVADTSTFKMDVRATIRTDDGALIYIHYTGYNYATGEKSKIMRSGQGYTLSPDDYYFRSTPVFETSAPQYAWLNHTIAVGVGRFPAQGKLIYRIYAIK